MSSWAMWSLLILLLVISLTPLVHPNPSRLVIGCLVESRIFTRTEDKYIDKRFPTPEEPSLPGPQVEELQKIVYVKEKRERPFECISNRTDELSKVLMKQNPKYQALARSCIKKQSQPVCDPLYKYRTIDGTCNNLMYPKWGSSLNCLQRFLPQRYEGVSGFRESVCGKTLPDPRTISLKIHIDQNRPARKVSHMTIFLGQLVAHDLSDIPITFVDTKFIDCCSHPGKNQHPQCAPIIISRDDPFYSKFDVTCFDFVRAAPCDTCDIGKRNQMNQATSYIDLSMVYGLNEKTASSLRARDGKGKLKSQYKNGEELLYPDHSLDKFGGCGSEAMDACFYAGDRRVNMHTPLMSLQTLFQREHNRIAEQLKELNSDWDDETLFQESRKINIAQMQVIVYKEFLPLIIGPDLLTRYGLNFTLQSLYDPSVDATMWAEFNVAAYRLHTTLNGIVTKYGCKKENRLLRTVFQDAEPLYKGNMSSLMRGICQSPAQQYDRHVAQDMTNFMYKPPKGSHGFDIVSVNIQRGRDVGLPSYTEMVRYLSGGTIDIQTFGQLDHFMDKENIKLLKDIYCDVRDIDLWVGMNNEKVLNNTLVAPTAGEIIAKQFSAIRKGDRFYFEHLDNFNNQQQTTLKQASFAKLMCENTKIKSIQQNALKVASSSGIILLVWIAMAPSVYLQSREETIIAQCLEDSKLFTRNEEKYIDRRKHGPEIPNLAGCQVQDFQLEVYSREERQRPFECISNRTDECSKVVMESHPKYQSLSFKCRKKQFQPSCDPSKKYRNVDGSCNNLFYPKWGSMLNCLKRLMSPRYAGTSDFRQSVCGKPLPDPRKLSLSIHEDKNKPTEYTTQIAIYFGQMLAHDIADTPPTFVGDKTIDCCSHPGKEQHPQCAPIHLSTDDPFHSKVNVTCFNFVRSAPCDTCAIGKRNQMNQATSFIDLSQVYGLSDDMAKDLRTNDGTGKLRSQHREGEELMPADYGRNFCGSKKNKEYCFLSGDRRVNMHTPLMAFHTLFQREHNRIAEQLNNLNPHWNDETLYQEARKINIAQFQVIVYKEFLPLIIGPKLLGRYGLRIKDKERPLYDPNVDSTLWAEFITAAFRLHSTVNGIVIDDGVTPDKRRLRNQFLDVEPLYKGNMTSLMNGMCLSAAQMFDRHVTKDMRDYMYKTLQGSWGFDIAAVNIQRGRDLGLPTYTEMVNYLSNGTATIQNFDELDGLMDRDSIEILRDHYCDVKDIDLWVGMNNEKLEENMLVGPTAGKIIAMQFSDLQKGDRFYFEHYGNFNNKQLKALKNTLFSRILCDNMKLKSIQMNAMMLPNDGNPVKFCIDIPKIDLSSWNDYCTN